MESKFKQKNLFESSFDLFEFDDGFFKKVDSELKKNKINEKDCGLLNKCNSKREDKQKEIKKISDIKDNSNDLPLFIEDLDESDFFDLSNSKCKKSLSKVNCKKGEKEKKGFSNVFTICLSPIQGPIASNKQNLSSSTPLKPNEDSLPKENPSTSQKLKKNSAKNYDLDYLEADLFDDWNIDEVNKNDTPKNTQKSTVTFSQAMKLIEEAESARELDQESLNHSLDLLTGEVIGADMGKMFEEPFDIPKSSEKKCEENDSVVVIDEFKNECKPAAAEKLNFGSEKVSCINLTNVNGFNFYGGFDSDDDFDFLTQELIKSPKVILKRTKPNSDLKNTKSITPEKDSDFNDSTDDIIRKKKKGKCIRIIESDGTEDSPSPKFLKRNNSKKRKNFQENFGREFIESEAEVSDEVEVSSDEIEVEGEYDKSFLDEESYYSQNCSANMTAKYLESVKTVHRNGKFKIPASKPYIPDNVFSQIPEESNTDYEIDSFCVPNDLEEEMKTDLSDLEVAEKILEMDRKKRKKKRSQKFRKLKY